MGDWWLGNDNRWHYDENAGKPDPAVTSMLPVVPTPHPRGGTVRYDEYEDHQLSGHVDPDEFPRFDGINSLMIRSIGAPD